ncbi:MAG: hypothetical protein ABIL52_06615 [candidate division WOR-3 bacterium]
MVKLNDWEIAFINRFVEYYNLYKGSSIRTQTVMEVLSREMAIDTQKVLNSFYNTLKKALSIEPSAIENLDSILSDELIENLKRQGFSYPVLKFVFPKKAKYKDIKFKENLLFSRGDDGLVRFWVYYDSKFYFLKEIGEFNGGYGPYELLGDYLFYAIDNKLIVYNVKSEIKLNEREFPNKIEALETIDDIVYVYYGKIKQGVKIFDNEILYDLAQVYEKIPTSITKIDLDDGFVMIHEEQIIYAIENNKSFSKLREYEMPAENIIYLFGKFAILKDNVFYLYDLEKNSVVLSLSDNAVILPKEDKIFVFEGNYLKVFDLNNLSFIKSFKIKHNVYSMGAFNNFLLIGCDGYLVVFKLKEKFLIKEFELMREFKKFEISKGKIKILKAYNDYIFAYSDDGNLIILDSLNFKEIYKIKVFLKDFIWTGKNLILIFEDRLDICKIDGKVQKSLDIKTSSYFIYNKELILGTEDGFVKFLNVDNFEIDREFKVSNTKIRAISSYKNYIFVVDSFGYYVFTINWEIKQIPSYNPVKSITGIRRFDDYLSIAYKNGEIKTYHRDGSLKSVMKTKGFENEEIVIDGEIKFYAFADGYIIVKGNKFYGSRNFRDYIYFVDGYDIIMSDKYYEFYEEPSLFDDLSLLNNS